MATNCVVDFCSGLPLHLSDTPNPLPVYSPIIPKLVPLSFAEPVANAHGHNDGRSCSGHLLLQQRDSLAVVTDTLLQRVCNACRYTCALHSLSHVLFTPFCVQVNHNRSSGGHLLQKGVSPTVVTDTLYGVCNE